MNADQIQSLMGDASRVRLLRVARALIEHDVRFVPGDPEADGFDRHDRVVVRSRHPGLFIEPETAVNGVALYQAAADCIAEHRNEMLQRLESFSTDVLHVMAKTALMRAEEVER